MKIAFVSDDHTSISTQYSNAKFYEIYILQVGKVIAHETVIKIHQHYNPNDYAEDHTDNQKNIHDYEVMIAPISDCEVAITRGISKYAHNSLIEHDIQPIITDISTIQDALVAFLSGTITNHPENIY